MDASSGQGNEGQRHGVQHLATFAGERTEKRAFDDSADGGVGERLEVVTIEGAVEETMIDLEVLDPIFGKINGALVGIRCGDAECFGRVELVVSDDNLLRFGLECSSG